MCWASRLTGSILAGNQNSNPHVVWFDIYKGLYAILLFHVFQDSLAIISGARTISNIDVTSNLKFHGVPHGTMFLEDAKEP